MHCRKSWSISSSHLGHFSAISWTYITNISEKYSPLYVLMYLQNCFGFFRTSIFRDIWRNIPRFILKIVYWLSITLHISQILFSLVSLVDKALASYMGGPWINSREEPFIQYRDKTSECSEIYREQLTSEHFLPYNYRSSKLLRISRNIGRLLRQCAYYLDIAIRPH
jgi:hypothetical protein